MMKRLSIVVLAALCLAVACDMSHAQTPAKLCFPTGTTGSGKAPSCQDVTATNPLPTTASISLGSAVNVTVVNTVGVPVFVSNPNGFGGTINGTLTVQNLAAGSNLNTLDTNSAAILAAVQAAIPAGTNLIGQVTATNIAQLAGGWTTITVANMLSPANAIKATPGQLAKLYCYNPNATVAYVQVFNTASGSVTTGTTKPAQFYGIPATNAAGFSMSPVGDQYTVAISAAATTTATGLTAPNTGLDCSFSFQ